MADREYFVEGVQVYESGEEEYFVEGVQLVEDQAAGTTCTLSGTAYTDTINEDDITAGGKTIILTLTGDTWAATVGDDNGITDALIAGLDGTGSGAGSWDDEVAGNEITFEDITREVDNVTVTIDLPSTPTYDISAQETVTATIPATALVNSADAVVASPAFTIDEVAAVGLPAGSLSLLGVGV